MARRQMGQMDTPAGEKRAAADEQRVGPLARKSHEGCIDLAAGAGVEHLDLQPHGAGRHFHVPQRGLGNRHSAGLSSTATRVAAGTSSRSSSSRFAANSAEKKLTPVRLPPGRARLATRPSLTGSSATRRQWGSSSSPPWPRPPCRTAARDDHGDLPANQLGRQRGQPIDLILGPAIFDRNVLALDIAGVFQALAKCRADGPATASGDRLLEEPDHRHRGCCARAASGHVAAAPPRSTEKFPPPHVRPSGSGDGIVSAQTSALIGAETGFATAT